MKEHFASLVPNSKVHKQAPKFQVVPKLPDTDVIYSMEFTVSDLTPYICSLSHLESGK